MKNVLRKINKIKTLSPEDKDLLSMLSETCWSFWEKEDMKRMYYSIEKDDVLELKYYYSGKIKSALLEGIKISNSEAYRLLAVKAYLDLTKLRDEDGNFLVFVEKGREDAERKIKKLALLSIDKENEG